MFSLIGLVDFIVASSLLVLNILILMTLSTYKEYKTGTYRIIKHICVSCVIQLVSFTGGGVMTICDSVFNYYIERVLGIIVESGWFPFIGLSLALAVDRLLITTLPKQRSVHLSISNCLIALSWFMWLASLIILSLPNFGYIYENNLGWTYDRAKEGARIMAEVESFIDISLFAFIFVIYLLVFGYFIKLRNTTSGFTPSSRMEMRILIIAVVSFVYESLFVIWSFWVPPIFLDKRHTRAFLNMQWIVDCGMLAMMTVLLNGRLRQNMVNMMLRKKKIAVFTVDVTRAK
ncbi:hypothetical protein QR680_003714 [Steinernema hermaphroditum]|uniref:7TM GPCR serpentine receptor class x (Srx) domain-containing protein n=1 Tax=Steinernema hermaphroditum TaxID=289476 RepID=A0AA39HMB4_9BILA|nr:hypothetical protein QR680_003714 [Steinernema hermaphroditum]